MKIVKFEPRKGELKALIRSFDDLITLSYVIEVGDKLTAYSQRKISVGDSKEIRPVKLSLEAENIKLTDSALEVSGKITASSDENVPLHKYHTIALRPHVGFALAKNKFLAFQVNMVIKSRERSPKILICVYEDGYALFYRITNYSTKRLYELKSAVAGKRFKNDNREVFFKKLATEIRANYEKTQWNLVLVGGKAIDNEALRKDYLKDLNISYEIVSYADTGLKEILTKDTVNSLLKNTKISLQRSLINEYIKEISDGEKGYVYGTDKIKSTIKTATPIAALLSRDFVVNNKDLIEELDKNGTEITFFDEKDESLDLLNGFGGAIVRFVT